MNTRETISAPEAAKLCGVSRSTIGNWIQAKRLFARRSGRVYTIQKIDLLLFIEAMGKSIPEELENEKFTQPLFRSFQHCWEFYGGHHHGGSYNACVASKEGWPSVSSQGTTAAFSARKAAMRADTTRRLFSRGAG